MILEGIPLFQSHRDEPFVDKGKKIKNTNHEVHEEHKVEKIVCY
jgi:hypothetical protein